jgi:hypothetical protein
MQTLNQCMTEELVQYRLGYIDLARGAEQVEANQQGYAAGDRTRWQENMLIHASGLFTLKPQERRVDPSLHGAGR